MKTGNRTWFIGGLLLKIEENSLADYSVPRDHPWIDGSHCTDWKMLDNVGATG